jgi:hypothetical protein
VTCRIQGSAVSSESAVTSAEAWGGGRVIVSYNHQPKQGARTLQSPFRATFRVPSDALQTPIRASSERLQRIFGVPSESLQSPCRARSESIQSAFRVPFESLYSALIAPSESLQTPSRALRVPLELFSLQSPLRAPSQHLQSPSPPPPHPIWGGRVILS